MCRQELLTRSALETQKLELMTEVSSLKLKLTAVERDHRDSEVTPLCSGAVSSARLLLRPARRVV